MPEVASVMRVCVRAKHLVNIGLCSVLAWGLMAGSVAAQFRLPDRPEGLPGGSLADIIANIIRAALTLVGVIALAFLVYGGFRYITSRGEEREIESAKATMTYAVLGMVFIGLAYALVTFVLGALQGGGGAGGG